MRVDLAEHTLSKEVEFALESIEELKNVSEGTREFIKYAQKYRQIMHSKICFRSIEDSRIKTLKKIRDWFVNGDKQKVGPMEWISSQCQFDLILSIDSFLGMIEFILKKYLGSMIQPRHVLQDMLEGLFGTIRELGGDSSTQTLKSYGHSLNKYQVTALVSSEIKSINYGKANSIGTGITSLVRRDSQKDKNYHEENKENSNIYQKYNARLLQLSAFSRKIFESILADNLIMGKFGSVSKSLNNNVNCENIRVYQLQTERYNLIEDLLYLDSIDKLLQSWQNIIKKIACEAIPKKIEVTKLHTSSTNRLVAYLLLQKVIEYTFRKKDIKKDQAADCNLIPKNIIVLEPAEASKFAYIVGWVVYKLVKSDNITKSHPHFKAICAYLEILNSEQVIYEQDVRSKITNVIPGQEFLEFMYKIESLILLLFEKYKELGPNILQYIQNSLLSNLPLLQSFNMLFDLAGQQFLACDTTAVEKHELKDDARNFLYERIISIYMRSRQKSWRRFNNLIPEKGTSSLRENLKTYYKDIQNTSRNENKFTLIKKDNILQDPLLGLKQLQIWIKLDNAEEVFSKIFQVAELQWLLWAFGDNVKNKRKKVLIPLIFDHLKKETQFCEEAISKGQMFAS
ncbi:hypothetical protein RclHR1_29880001 [Rhizophagus clarus]|uniref:Uncharacterized protein n=2 Tax=Rhizophagus clarus TaxID=94130 RepID=A0A2Z6R4V9_9GLOM|nr:hypothetical protein RclHR1_29880001 [Rhizophagus clarus]